VHRQPVLEILHAFSSTAPARRLPRRSRPLTN
jgi:hypothetical protein